MARPRLGDILVKLGFLDAQQLQAALGHQKQWGLPLAKTVVEKRFCTVEQVMQALSQQTGFGIVDVDREALGAQLAPLLPRKVAEIQKAVPLRAEGKRLEVLVVAIAAPATLGQLDAIASASGKQRVVPFLAWDDAIERALGRIYRGESFVAPPSAPDRPSTPVAVDAREQEFDLGPAEPAPVTDPIEALHLSEPCRRVIKTAAEQHQISEVAVAARVLESWASRQRG